MSLLIVGHRGAMAHAPENSLASYALAEASGVDEIELDVRVTSDGELVLVHDATLDRTAGDDTAMGLGPIADLTLVQVRAAKLNSGEPAPTLLEMYEATHTEIQLEIKDPAAVPLLKRFFDSRPADAERTILASFSPDALRHACELMPQIRRSIITATLSGAEDFSGGWRGLVKYSRATRVACGFEGLTKDLVSEMHASGLEVHGWPMRAPKDMQTALRVGVDGTTADDPAMAREWYEKIRSVSAHQPTQLS